ncbi:hypothetical protein BS78_03G195500 [Paspalum vaginatum]|nr:hypothetical protein BS78_03G195500 [Paspalum vaginatum]
MRFHSTHPTDQTLLSCSVTLPQHYLCDKRSLAALRSRRRPAPVPPRLGAVSPCARPPAPTRLATARPSLHRGLDNSLHLSHSQSLRFPPHAASGNPSCRRCRTPITRTPPAPSRATTVRHRRRLGTPTLRSTLSRPATPAAHRSTPSPAASVLSTRMSARGDLRKVPNAEDSYPERPGEPDCPYLMKSSRCKFKSKCKFNHPKEKVNALEAATDNARSLISDSAILPVRPSEPVCSFYAKTGKCGFGAVCKFNHPKDSRMAPVIAKETIYTATTDAEAHIGAADGSVPAKTHAPTAPAEAHNAKGLPLRPGEVDCSFYMKTGSCKYGSICRYNHPDRPALTAPLVQTTIPIPAPIVPSAVLNPAVGSLQSFDFHATHLPVEPVPIIYPQRPGETVCDFYMKRGYCNYKQKCKFHHPINGSLPGANENGEPQQPVTLTLAGLPRREDAEICAFYMTYGTCQHGVHCKFDHPPPQEAIAKLQATGKEGEKTEKEEGEKEGR